MVIFWTFLLFELSFNFLLCHLVCYKVSKWLLEFLVWKGILEFLWLIKCNLIFQISSKQHSYHNYLNTFQISLQNIPIADFFCMKINPHNIPKFILIQPHLFNFSNVPLDHLDYKAIYILIYFHNLPQLMPAKNKSRLKKESRHELQNLFPFWVYSYKEINKLLES